MVWVGLRVGFGASGLPEEAEGRLWSLNPLVDFEPFDLRLQAAEVAHKERLQTNLKHCESPRPKAASGLPERVGRRPPLVYPKLTLRPKAELRAAKSDLLFSKKVTSIVTASDCK